MSDVRYLYQTLRVPARGPSHFGDPSGDRFAAGVELLQKLSIALNGMAVSWRVNRELEGLRDRLDSERQAFAQQNGVPVSRVGVLVVVGLMEWRQADVTETKAQSFLSIHSAGPGTDAATVLRQYQNTPQLVNAAPQGWVRKDEYIWASVSD